MNNTAAAAAATDSGRTTFFVDEHNSRCYYGSTQREVHYGYRVTPHLVVVHVRHDTSRTSTAIVRRDF